jgi:hypothetical protein
MRSRHKDKPQVEWKVGDVRDMTEIATKSVDVAFDKGTLDAMIHGSPWSPPDEVMKNTGRYINEVGWRVEAQVEVGHHMLITSRFRGYSETMACFFTSPIDSRTLSNRS